MEDKRKNTIFANRIITQNKTTMKKLLFTLVTMLLPVVAWAAMTQVPVPTAIVWAARQDVTRTR